MRRPLDGPVRVTSDTYEHWLRGVGPATDYAAPTTALPIGTPVVAPFAFSRVLYWGKADNPKGYPGGLAVNLYSEDGRFIFTGQHLSRYAYNTRGAAGTVVAYSGNTGASTGPHLHCYVIADGVRMSMEEALAEYGGDTAGNGQPLPEPTPDVEDDMFTEDDRKKITSLSKSLGRIELALTRTPGATFFKHGDMPKDKPLWLFVMPDGNFVRIKDQAEAALYKERNGGVQATVLSGEAIRLLRDDLIAAGGRDLSEDES